MFVSFIYKLKHQIETYFEGSIGEIRGGPGEIAATVSYDG